MYVCVCICMRDRPSRQSCPFSFLSPRPGTDTDTSWADDRRHVRQNITQTHDQSNTHTHSSARWAKFMFPKGLNPPYLPLAIPEIQKGILKLNLELSYRNMWVVFPTERPVIFLTGNQYTLQHRAEDTCLLLLCHFAVVLNISSWNSGPLSGFQNDFPVEPIISLTAEERIQNKHSQFDMLQSGCTFNNYKKDIFINQFIFLIEMYIIL